MIDSDRNGTGVDRCDRTDRDRDASALESPPRTDADTKAVDARIPPLRVRSIRSRRDKRTQRRLGEPVTIELRDGSRIAATLVDQSASGLGVKVADASLFHRCQIVAVRQRGVKSWAMIRNVHHEAESCRLALKLLPG